MFDSRNSCLYPGCGLLLAKGNRHGYCQKHAMSKKGRKARRIETERWNALEIIYGAISASNMIDFGYCKAVKMELDYI